MDDLDHAAAFRATSTEQRSSQPGPQSKEFGHRRKRPIDEAESSKRPHGKSSTQSELQTQTPRGNTASNDERGQQAAGKQRDRLLSLSSVYARTLDPTAHHAGASTGIGEGAGKGFALPS